jgi:hypothetical protein
VSRGKDTHSSGEFGYGFVEVMWVAVFLEASMESATQTCVAEGIVRVAAVRLVLVDRIPKTSDSI